MNNGSRENNDNRLSVSFNSQELDGGHALDFASSSTGGQMLEKESSFGSLVNCKPIERIHSGSSSSRGSGFIHSSSSKSTGVDSLDIKVVDRMVNISPLQSPTGDDALCVTSRAPAEETNSCKKPRPGWGQGLAKYERQNVDIPEQIADEEVGTRNEICDCNLEPSRPSPANLADKSPKPMCYLECTSPTTPSLATCSSSLGVEEKVLVKAATGKEICHPSVPSCHLSQNYADGLAFDLEHLELAKVFNFSFSISELLQSDDSRVVGSGFVKSTAMGQLQVWKAHISKTLEVTESEIDSLENELKLSISDVESSCSHPAASSSLSSPQTMISSGDIPMEDGERTEAKYFDIDISGTTSKFVEPPSLCNNISPSGAVKQSDCPVNLNIRSEILDAKCSMDAFSDETLGFSLSTCSADGAVQSAREDRLYHYLLASNRDLAIRACEEFNKLIPTTQWSSNISRATSASLIKEKIARRKRFIKLKERIITLKFRAFQYLWKEDLRLLSIRSFSAKSLKKAESSLLTACNRYQKHRPSIRSRFSHPAGIINLVPTTKIMNYTMKLFSNSRVRIYRNTLKMPAVILDKSERMTSRFISDNGLVEDPRAVEKERCVLNPWSSEEKKIFFEKFTLLGKDFRRIASFLGHKTVADCVEFYYKNHKSGCFQKTKKNSEFAKQGKFYSSNKYLVTSGKQWNQETNPASLDMLGAASVVVANPDGRMGRHRKCPSKFYVGTSNDHKLLWGDGDVFERSSGRVLFGNERETAAANVLVGICGSISPEASSSCTTSSMGRRDVYHQEQRCRSSKRRPLIPEAAQNDVVEETYSEASCGEEIDSACWTDKEKSNFIQAVACYGKDFAMISRCMRTRSRDQCKLFFSKARTHLGLDMIHVVPDDGDGLELNAAESTQKNYDRCTADCCRKQNEGKFSNLKFCNHGNDRRNSDRSVIGGSSNKITEPMTTFEMYYPNIGIWHGQ